MNTLEQIKELANPRERELWQALHDLSAIWRLAEAACSQTVAPGPDVNALDYANCMAQLDKWGIPRANDGQEVFSLFGRILKLRESLAAPPAVSTPRLGTPEGEVYPDWGHPPSTVSEATLDLICRDVAELPDRDSPEDWPEAMLVTYEELKTIIRERLNEQSH